ncbi:LysR family transcriptional regulator [Streptomyces boluensis]|uniref:LysR family transcriptional regulator n=1 Tax=Streptomyces boluensis TaxID=1775135 RepID=A0A964V0Y3_9ACTN|nr:LysR substrate-binding domain-containing protein [Streptomyces boluensis]NBE56567.1 LysR family transcriptional regulator [Streptomyces boluensis]
MELRQLRYFVTVVEEANFTRAAARLHLAQPGVSAQIRQLERELGHPLLDRSGRTVALTEVGAAVLPYARAALAAVDGLRDTVDEYAGLLRGHVAIGLVSGAAAHELDVAAVLADFHDAHPGVGIALTEDTSERMLAALRHGELDIAVIGLTGAALGPGIAHEVLVDVPLVAAVAPDDPLLASDDPLLVATGRAGVPLTALRDRPLISLPRGTGIRGVLDGACAAAGFTPRIAFEAAAPELLGRLAARGLGAAVVPALTADEAAQLGLRTVPFTDSALRGRVALAWRTDGPSGPAARELLRRLRLATADRASGT